MATGYGSDRWDNEWTVRSSKFVSLWIEDEEDVIRHEYTARGARKLAQALMDAADAAEGVV